MFCVAKVHRHFLLFYFSFGAFDTFPFIKRLSSFAFEDTTFFSSRLFFCHLLLQMKKNTRILTKTYSTFSLYSFLVMQKILTSHCVRKIKIPENKSFERTLNHRVFICIPEHMPTNFVLFYHTSWEIR